MLWLKLAMGFGILDLVLYDSYDMNHNGGHVWHIWIMSADYESGHVIPVYYDFESR